MSSAPRPTNISMRHLVMSALMVLIWQGSAAPALAQSIKLAPHRAVYDLSLDRASAGSGISELTGRMVYELKGDACKGYEQTIRFVTRTENPKGASTVTDLRSVYWEEGDADGFRFDTTQYQNERLTERTTGSARRAGKTKSELRLDIRRPVRKRTKLGGDVMFPIQHSIGILQSARAGKRLFTADLYDGSEKGLKVYETSAVMGNPRPAGSDTSIPKIKNAEVMQQVAAWPVSLSYYGKTEKRADAVPEYELSFLFYDNGISRKLVIDYGSFSIRGVLTRLDMLPESDCKQSN